MADNLVDHFFEVGHFIGEGWRGTIQGGVWGHAEEGKAIEDHNF